jgi:arabinogalactan endo-1,4-beta-galactosidase
VAGFVAASGWGGCASGTHSAKKADFAVGADLSFLAESEAGGDRFKDGGGAKKGLVLFRDHGYTWVRLRLFHTPGAERHSLPNDLASTISQARRAKEIGFKLLLDFHYSDTWADPMHQTMPSAWEGLTLNELTRAVHDYTRDCLIEFRDAGAMPDMVQTGNEVTAGMLWPIGKLPENWGGFTELMKAGIAGVRDGSDGAVKPRILVQIERSGSWSETKYFFDHLLSRGVKPDVLGQSYYPWWHGSTETLRATLNAMAREYGKPVMVVETAYPWKPSEYRDKPAPFPETPEGQREFLATVGAIVRAVPNGLGAGVFWWEPAVGRDRGRKSLRSRGMFDDSNNALPVIDALPEPHL